MEVTVVAAEVKFRIWYKNWQSPVTPQMLTLHYYSYGCPENVTQLYKETTQQTRMMRASKRPRSSKHHPEDQDEFLENATSQK